VQCVVFLAPLRGVEPQHRERGVAPLMFGYRSIIDAPYNSVCTRMPQFSCKIQKISRSYTSDQHGRRGNSLRCPISSLNVVSPNVDSPNVDSLEPLAIRVFFYNKKAMKFI
jgi:hypothetical protein